MEISEKKEQENNNNISQTTTLDSSSTADIIDKESEERQARDLKAGLHPLKHKFIFWYTRRTPGVRTQTSYEDNIKKIVEFSTVEGFWVCYCHLARPSLLPSPTDLHLFKEGIRPLWEDSANCNGGKWIIRFKKVVSGRFWEDLVLALVGDQLDYSDDICGAVLSIRYNEDILSVWNRNASDRQGVMALRDAIKRHLKLPHSYVMDYKPHDASLRDNSSYRNTWLRGLKCRLYQVKLNVGFNELVALLLDTMVGCKEKREIENPAVVDFYLVVLTSNVNATMVLAPALNRRYWSQISLASGESRMVLSRDWWWKRKTTDIFVQPPGQDGASRAVVTNLVVCELLSYA
ncbi:hypothetical protein OIU77_004193 [Salix suchowensis]|nr:hypothetical protein OIU77_004193 [Salix suchowensis]